MSDHHILCQLRTQTKQCRQKKFQQQWVQFDHLKQNLFQLTLESHDLWNIPDTDYVVKLCSDVWFKEYTQSFQAAVLEVI